jgi:hypothetical protein
MCVLCIVLKWLEMTLDITALLELETLAFPYTLNNIFFCDTKNVFDLNG